MALIVGLALSVIPPTVLADTSASRPIWPAIAVDSNNHVHVVYDNADGNGIIYASNRTGEWVRKRITSGDDSLPRLAVDHLGKIHVIFRRTYQDAPRRLFYITNRGGEWNTTKLPWKAPGSTVHVAVAPDRKVHFVFATDEAVYYATNDDGTWHRERLDVYFGTRPVITVDVDGFVHIAFGQCAVDDEDDCVDEGIYYRTNRSGSWVQERITQSQQDRAGSIVTDADGNAHVAFDRPSEIEGRPDLAPGLFYMTNKSGTWMQQKIIGSGRSGRLGIDPMGFIHIVFSRDHEDLDGIYYATNETGAWVRSTVVKEKAMYGEMAVDRHRNLRVAFMRMEVDPGVYYTTNRTGSWTRLELMD